MSSLTSDQIESLRDVFMAQSDSDGEGLSEEGLRKLLLNIDIDESFAPPMLRIINGHSKTGKITFDEFKNFMNILLSQNIKEFFRLLFNAIDNDNDGKLDAEDLVEFGKIIGDEMTLDEAEKIVQTCDQDENGLVEFEEFYNLFSERQDN